MPNALTGKKQTKGYIAKRSQRMGTPAGKEAMRSALAKRWGDQESRFWAGVKMGADAAACWQWAKATDQHGYGCITFDGRLQKAHRVSYMVANGEIPSGMCVLHRCDNPGCVNPGHLFLGSQADNMADMAAKGRAVGGPGAKPGENHHHAKLSVDIVRLCRERHAAGETVAALAREFGVAIGTMHPAVHGKTWKVA